jgi:hypothetical protein
MSRNGSGTFNLTSGNPVVTGTTISSSWANNTLSDIANGLTQSIAADGQTPITGPLTGTNGTVVFGGVGQTQIPSGTTAQRSSTPASGMIRYNTDINSYEGYTGLGWVTLQQTISFKNFGAIGDGTTDDTTAVTNAINYVNSNRCVLTGDNLIYLVQAGALPAVTSTAFVFRDATLRTKTGTVGNLLSISGANAVLQNITIDGNQNNITSASNSNLGLVLSGTNPNFVGCNFINNPTVGLQLAPNTVLKGLFVNCNFYNNASLALQTYQAAYCDFTNCTFNANGYGFQNTRPYPSNTTSANQIGFGVAIRCQSHHITFTNCQFNDNGRDGLAVGQGSYKIKAIGCQALRNGDGGFTGHNDNTGTGLPGEGTSPYNLSYTDCEAGNNYTSGIAMYSSVYGIQVIGGTYYNNHREAGDLTEQTAFYNGIYIAAGSQDVVIRDVRCFDDRQFTSIPTGSTATGTGPYSLVLSNWFTGTLNYYPKLAFYNPQGSFYGYATLVSETATSITFTPTTVNGVNPALLGGGWYVTQRVQQNGVFVDNNSQGSVEAICSGHMQGVSASITGYDIISGAYANGQNINLLKNIIDQTELLTNPDFNSSTTGWTSNTPGGGSFAVSTSIARSAGSGRLIAGSSEADADATLITNAYLYAAGGWLRFSAWVYTSAWNGAGIELFWSGSYLTSLTASQGENTWELLEITIFVPPGTTTIQARLFCNPGVTAYFDNLSLRGIAPPQSGNSLGLTSQYLSY